MTKQTFKLTIAYEGTEFYGWQKTSSGSSIQEELELAFLKITKKNLKIEAASRTDRGVHARGQVVHVSLEKDFDPKRLTLTLNAILPKSICVHMAEKVSSDFHATLLAQEKTYCYFICTNSVQLPMHRLHSWHVPHILDLDAMMSATNYFLGTHDFSSFTQEVKEDPIRTLYALDCTPLEQGRLKITLRGDRFLYKMARIITGTIVDIGTRKLHVESISKLLSLKDRTKAGVTAPAHGLFLWNVGY